MQPGYNLYPLVSLVAVYVCPVSATELSSRIRALVSGVERCLELVYGYMYPV